MSENEQYTDLELMELIQADDSRGLDELFRRYAHRLCDFAYQYVQDLEVAKELVSDVFLRLWIKRKELKIRHHVISYLYTSIKNHSLNYLRGEKQQFVELTAVETSDNRSTWEADQAIQEAETVTLMEKILQDLPPQRKLVFRMHRIEGLAYREIAHILSISENTVHRHMVAAIKQLAKAYPDWKDWIISVWVFLSMLLVLCQVSIDGYSLLSLTLASWVVNCQLTPFCC